MFRIFSVIFALAAACPVMAEDTSRFYALYGELLAQYWRPTLSIHGIETTVFDYDLMKREAVPLMNDIVSTLDVFDPSSIGDDDAVKAFWINVYNFTAMRMVVEAYPVDSITSFKISLIKHPWSKKSIGVRGRRYSLSDIEKEILLARFNDPRIVFAVSCAAVSCPDRTPEVFDGTRIDSQLNDLLTNYFRNSGKGMLLNREARTLTLAWILSKDGHLFQTEEGGVMAFVTPYLHKEEQEWLASHQVTIDYFEHDWTLNDLAQADGR
tara:strand:+ start:1227 stop:2027 length:801 start_codon:yes stop_codon:yes gene_type:complete